MSDAAQIQRFYGRWARLYDAVATFPGVDRVRARAADALALDPGDTVVETGCGTGANLPHLRERVGPSGQVVGLDLTRPLLDRARERADRWENVHVVQADATAPPVDGSVDAVLASFVTGMLGDPPAAVEEWLGLLAHGGQIALLDGRSSPRSLAAPLNLAFAGFVWAGAPGKGRVGARAAVASLDRRVESAHGVVQDRCDDPGQERHLAGMVVLTSGEAPASSE